MKAVLKPSLKTLIIFIVLVAIFLPLSQLSFSLFGESSKRGKAYFIAHRGLSSVEAENSYASVQAALDANCTHIELDVHQSADGGLFILHDFTLDRTTELSGLISRTTSKQLRAYNQEVKVPSEMIPELDSVVQMINGKAELILEIKAGSSFYPEIERRVIETIRKYKAEHWISIHSFSDEVIDRCFALDSAIELHKLMILCIPSINLIIDEAIHFRSIESYAGVTCFSLFYPFANKKFIDLIHLQNKKVHTWNVSSKRISNNLEALGVDGIITDHADKFMKAEH